MHEEKLEQLLGEIYLQDIIPSEKLVQRTKYRLSKNRYTEYLIVLVVSFNLAAFLAFIGFVLVAPYDLITKTLLYMAVSCVYNSVALAACLYKDQINGFFQKIQGG